MTDFEKAMGLLIRAVAESRYDGSYCVSCGSGDEEHHDGCWVRDAAAFIRGTSDDDQTDKT